jgi:lipopolysaccharide transport system permease protein
MSSLAIWNYFSACLTNTSNTFIANASIFGKVYFPRLVLPLSVIISNLVRFGIQFTLLFILMLYFFFTGKFVFHFGLHTLLLPLIALIMASLGLGLGIIISSLTTKYRDFTVLITFGVQLLMYLTPVAYPLSFVMDSKYKYLMLANPLSSLVEGFRYALFGTGTFDYTLFGYSIGFTLVALFIGIVLFNKVERSFMDTV